MRIVYITSYSFPAKRAEPYHVKSLAAAFAKQIGSSFLFVINGGVPPELDGIQTISVEKKKRFRALFYFFWFPRFVRNQKLQKKDTIFISNDAYLLLIFIFWKKVFRFSYQICADWHLLFEDWKDHVIIRNCDYVLSTTERLKKLTVAKCKNDPEKILVAYGGVDQNLFSNSNSVQKGEIRARLGLPREAFLVGYIGSFRGMGLEKGLHTMIAALPELPQDVRMVFVGGTHEQVPDYETYAEEKAVRERCTFVERQSFENVIAYEQAMDILVIPYPDHPHFRDYGLPIKVWEYMATGRPIIYSDLETTAEVLKGRATSFIPDSPQSLAQAIIHMQADFKNVDEAAKKNREDIQQYTWEKKVLKTLDFFNYSNEGNAKQEPQK